MNKSSSQKILKPGDLFYVSYAMVPNSNYLYMFDIDDENYIEDIYEVKLIEPVMFLQQVSVRKAPGKTNKAYYINIDAVKILYKNQIKYLPMNYTEIILRHYNSSCKLQMDIVKT